MLPDQNVCFECTKGAIASLRKMGYTSVECGDVIYVPVSRLLPNSNKRVTVICDYCGSEYSVMFSDLTKMRNKCDVVMDACSKCRKKKSSDVLRVRYGVDLPLNVPGAYQKMIKTIEEKYGFGKRNIFPKEDVEYDSALSRAFMPGRVWTSKPQKQMYETLRDAGYDVRLNYATEWGFLDVALFVHNAKVDVEYDGRYWHDMNLEHDAKRNVAAENDGWKVIRFRGKSIAPTIEQLNTAIEIAINENRPLQIIELAG